ncbi:putative TIR-NBS-LRR resistance protein, partial [Trifolium pratense]
VWKEIVTARYGRDIIGKKDIGVVDAPRTASLWWKDLCSLDSNDGWFRTAVGKKVGRGDATSFWNEVWIGNQSLRQRFPRLFGISSQQNDVIKDMGRMMDGRWHWEFTWRRERFVWEEEHYGQFVEILAPFIPVEANDRWLWLGDGIQGFTVNSAYLLLENAAPIRRTLDPLESFV